MGGWLGALVTLAKPVLARVLLALGMSVVTITGVEMSIGAVKPMIVAYIAGAPSAAIQLAGKFGCWTALGLILGAITFALAYWTLTQSVKVLGVGS